MYQRIVLIGSLAKEPQIRDVSDKKMASLLVATWHSKYNHDKRQWEKDTTFHNVTVWGKQAEYAETKLAKGDMVMVEGELNINSWKGRDGTIKHGCSVNGIVKKIPTPFPANTYAPAKEPQTTWTPDNANPDDNYGSASVDDLPF